jgi:hypothetical protein
MGYDRKMRTPRPGLTITQLTPTLLKLACLGLVSAAVATAADGDWKKVQKIANATIEIDASSEIKEQPFNLHIDIDAKPQTMTFKVGGYTKWECNISGEQRNVDIAVTEDDDWKAAYADGTRVKAAIGRMIVAGSDKLVATFHPADQAFNHIEIACKVTAQPGPGREADPDGPETKEIKWQPEYIKTWVAKLSGQLGRSTANNSDAPIIHKETEPTIAFEGTLDVGPLQLTRGDDLASVVTEKDKTVRVPNSGKTSLPDKDSATFMVAAVTNDGNDDLLVGRFHGHIKHRPLTRFTGSDFGGYVRVDNELYVAACDAALKYQKDAIKGLWDWALGLAKVPWKASFAADMASNWVEKQTAPILSANAFKAEAVLGLSAAMAGDRAKWKTPERKIDIHLSPGFVMDTVEKVTLKTPLSEFQKVFEDEALNSDPDHIEYASNVCLDACVQIRYSVEQGHDIPGHTTLIGGHVAPNFWGDPIPINFDYVMACTIPVFTK